MTAEAPRSAAQELPTAPRSPQVDPDATVDANGPQIGAERIAALTEAERESVCVGGFCGYLSLGKHTVDCAEHIATVESIVAARVDAAFIDGTHVIGDKVIRLAQSNAILARANGRAEERRWLDLIHALEADLALIDRQEQARD